MDDIPNHGAQPGGQSMGRPQDMPMGQPGDTFQSVDEHGNYVDENLYLKSH